MRHLADVGKKPETIDITRTSGSSRSAKPSAKGPSAKPSAKGPSAKPSAKGPSAKPSANWTDIRATLGSVTAESAGKAAELGEAFRNREVIEKLGDFKRAVCEGAKELGNLYASKDLLRGGHRGSSSSSSSSSSSGSSSSSSNNSVSDSHSGKIRKEREVDPDFGMDGYESEYERVMDAVKESTSELMNRGLNTDTNKYGTKFTRTADKSSPRKKPRKLNIKQIAETAELEYKNFNAQLAAQNLASTCVQTASRIDREAQADMEFKLVEDDKGIIHRLYEDGSLIRLTPQPHTSNKSQTHTSRTSRPDSESPETLVDTSLVFQLDGDGPDSPTGPLETVSTALQAP
jgi:hypothetical protein